MNGDDPRDLVRRGYDALSYRYRADDADDGRYGSLEEQPPLLGRIAGWLRPEGWLLVTTGHRAWTGAEDGWLGGTVPMRWSHADAATYRTWLRAAGLRVTTEDFVPEGDGGHALFWAYRP